MPVGPEKEKAIELAVSSIEKAFGKGSIMRLGNEEALVKDIQAGAACGYPVDLYEAARIDGASAWQQLRYITLPLLNAQIIMVCILELIFNFKMFDQVYATTQGGPAGASQTIIMLLYDTAFKYFRFGDASVMAVFVFVSLMVVTLKSGLLVRPSGLLPRKPMSVTLF